ncbi:MAG: glycosyltransferase, partial [Chloroflexi bacterium]|nr:glycosyltransferase [Chloroflexota bacterium]
YEWEVIVVDDGSTDDTAQMVGDWSQTHPTVRLEMADHRGKGWAVRRGMLSATGANRFMCDADLAMPIQLLDRFLEHMDAGYQIVIGSRQAVGARRFDEPTYRHVMGRVFNWVIKLVAVREFQDTQCGFKCFDERTAVELFNLQRNPGWGFDGEILYLATRKGLKILEMPVDWYYQSGSKIRPGVDAFLMLKETLAIRWNHLRGAYGRLTRERD